MDITVGTAKHISLTKHQPIGNHFYFLLELGLKMNLHQPPFKKAIVLIADINNSMVELQDWVTSCG